MEQKLSTWVSVIMVFHLKNWLLFFFILFVLLVLSMKKYSTFHFPARISWQKSVKTTTKFYLQLLNIHTQWFDIFDALYIFKFNLMFKIFCVKRKLLSLGPISSCDLEQLSWKLHNKYFLKLSISKSLVNKPPIPIYRPSQGH